MDELFGAVTNGLSEPSHGESLPEIVSDSEATVAGQASERVDFKSYSMAAPAPVKLERRELGAVRVPYRNGGLVKPAFEVSLNLKHVDPHLDSLQYPDLWASEQYDGLALKLIAATIKQPFKRILLASTHQGEGRTSVLLNLAVSLARAGKRVLVIDSDLLRPSVLRLLGIEAEIGIAEAFGRGLPLREAVLRIQPCGFDVLPTRERVDNHVEILTSAAFWEMLETLDSDYDFILFDSPPMLARPDSSMLIRLADTALIVVRPGMTRSAQMARALALLAEGDIFGVVLNRIPG